MSRFNRTSSGTGGWSAAASGAAAAPVVTKAEEPAGIRAARRAALEAVLVAMAGVLPLVPFLDKAFHIDDPLFLYSAAAILRDPTDFFAAEVNWYGRPMPLHEVTKNPPLAAYYLAAAARIGGFGEAPLHAAFLLPAALAAAGGYLVARVFCARPLVAGLIAAWSPAAVVSGTTLMCDTMQLAWWCWALALWMGDEDGRRPYLSLAAVLAASAAALTKYFGIALVPLLAAETLLARRRLTPRLAWLLVPLAAIAAFELYGRQRYGHPLVLSAADYATTWSAQEGGVGTRLIAGLTFLGGTSLAVALFAPWLWPRRGVVAGLLLAAIVAGLVVMWTAGAGQPPAVGSFSLRTADGVRWSAIVQLVAMVGLGLATLELLVRDGAWWRGERRSALLLLWIVGTLIFASVVNWTVNVRSLLPIVPAVAILIERRLERRAAEKGGVAMPRWAMPAALAALLAVALGAAWGDYVWAKSARQAAAELWQGWGRETSRLWFQGHWGFQYYLDRAGGIPLDLSRETLDPGQLMVLPENNTSLYDFSGVLLEDGHSVLVERGRVEIPLSGWLHTGSPPLGASFYASVRGPLPFAFGPPATEVYRVFQTRRPLSMKVDIR